MNEEIVGKCISNKDDGQGDQIQSVSEKSKKEFESIREMEKESEYGDDDDDFEESYPN